MRARIQIGIDAVEGKNEDTQAAAIATAERLARELGDVEVEVLLGLKSIASFSPTEDAALAEMLVTRGYPLLAHAVRHNASVASELRRFESGIRPWAGRLLVLLSTKVAGQSPAALLRAMADTPSRRVEFSPAAKDFLLSLAELADT